MTTGTVLGEQPPHGTVANRRRREWEKTAAYADGYGEEDRSASQKSVVLERTS